MFTHQILVFAFCLTAVWLSLGILTIGAISFVAFMSEEGFKRYISRGLEDIKLPFGVVCTMFFACIVIIWPFIVSSVWKSEKKEEGK